MKCRISNPKSNQQELDRAIHISLACFGCGHEHGCSVHGCALIKAAIKELNGTVKANNKEQSDG